MPRVIEDVHVGGQNAVVAERDGLGGVEVSPATDEAVGTECHMCFRTDVEKRRQRRGVDDESLVDVEPTGWVDAYVDSPPDERRPRVAT